MGNIMNTGSKNEQSVGFDISYLPKLSNTKDRDNKLTLRIRGSEAHLVMAVRRNQAHGGHQLDGLQHDQRNSRCDGPETWQ